MIVTPIPQLPLNTIVVVEPGTAGVVGPLDAFYWNDGDSAKGVRFFIHPEEIENFLATWFPSLSIHKGRIN